MTRQTRTINNRAMTKNSLSLQEFGVELKRQKESKRDFLAVSNQLDFRFNEEEKFELEIGDIGTFGVKKLFHDQLSSHYSIPKKYYERIQADYPELLETTINAHFQKTKEKRLVRTLEGDARAFLSNSYRPMDNIDLAFNAVLPALGELSDDKIRFECQLTETRMYIKAIMLQVQGEVTKGDIVQAGVMIRNSEVGHSSLAVEPFANRLVCMNGMVMPISLRKFHAGVRNNDFDDVKELLLSDTTKKLRDAQLWSEVRDLVTATTSQKTFHAMLEPMKEAADREMENKPTEAVEVVAEWYGFDEQQKDDMLNNLIAGKDMTHWGIVNAVTAMAHNEEDYDRATELQQIGGELLQLDKKDVKLLLSA